MALTNFIPRQTLVTAEWLNGVDGFVNGDASTVGVTKAELAAPSGAGLVGVDDNAGGVHFTTVQGFIDEPYLMVGTTTPTTDGAGMVIQTGSRNAFDIYGPVIPPGYFFSDTLRVVASQEVGSTVQHATGIGIYTYTNVPLGTTPNEKNTVGLFVEGVIDVDGGKTWSINTAVIDNVVNGLATLNNRVMIGWEADFEVNGASTVQGIALFIQGAGTPANANGVQLAQQGTAKWTNGFITDDGSVTGKALSIGASASTGANSPGQQCSFNFLDGANTVRAMILQANNSAFNITCSNLSDGFYFQAGAGNVTLGVAGSSPNANIFITPSGTGQLSISTSVFAAAGFQLPSSTVAALPSPIGRQGFMRQVSDAGAVIYRGVATGGGTNITNVTSDGTNWLYM